MLFFSMCVIAAGIGMSMGVIGPGIGMGLAVKGALDGTSRNPALYGKLLTTMMIGLAMIESLAIYALVICLIILYANPFMKFIPEAAKAIAG
jgi:F-type H+-transporting ATPase subunit c